MNSEDLDARRIYQQARPPAMGTHMNAATAASSPVTGGTSESSTFQDSSGNPLRLWIPGFDPFDTAGFYFGNEPLPEISI